MTLVNFKPNEIVVNQGDPGDSFFYILTGLVKIVVSKKVEIGNDIEHSKYTIDKYITDLKAGQTFGELSLIYGTPRSATIIAVMNSLLIKIDKLSFDTYVKDIFENQLKDQIDFMKICPIFHRVPKEVLVKLAITTDRKKYMTNQNILQAKNKSEFLYIIRRGNVKVIKPINFIKDESAVKKKLNTYKNLRCITYDDLKFLKEINEEKLIDILSQGPTEEDFANNNIIERDITLENLKMGDIFPSYYSSNNVALDVYYEAENPCELIVLKLNDLNDIVNEAFKFIQSYAKPYPTDDFIRKFYYYNSVWINFKNTLKQNIIADGINKELLRKNCMRKKLINRKDIHAIQLPLIFSNKKLPSQLKKD
jgi:CRP-like cAMP-binding protein